MTTAAPSRSVLALLYAGMVLAWGLNFIFVRIGLSDSPPLWLAAMRGAVATPGVALGLRLWRSGEPVTTRERRDSLLLGIPTTALFFGLWFSGAAQVPPGETAVIVYTFPLWVAILSYFIFTERPSRWTWPSVAVGFIGIVLVEQPWNEGAGHLPFVAVVELLVAAASWALGTVFLKHRIRGPALRSANGYQLASGAAILVVIALVIDRSPSITLSTGLVESVLWLGLVGTAFANVVWFLLLEKFSASTISTWAFLTPVVALVASVLIFSERLDWVQVVGVAAVLCGIVVIARTDVGELVPSGSGE